MNPKTKITPHFTWGEARCKCGCVMSKSVQANVKKAALIAEAVREFMGNSAIRVLSWHRCAAYNASIGGAKNSQHLLGNALDIVIRGLSPMQVQLKCRELQARSIVGGLGMYPGFTHIDRGARRWWNANQPPRSVKHR